MVKLVTKLMEWSVNKSLTSIVPPYHNYAFHDFSYLQSTTV